MADEETFRSCEACGATIYPEHIERKVAGEHNGKLLCMHCLSEIRAAAGDAVRLDEDHATIALSGAAPTSGPAIRAFGGGPGGMTESMVGATFAHQDLHRPLLKGAPAATRCRTFHCKLTDAAITYMNEQINTWADEDENIAIKFATSTIGVVEGKHADPHLLITVFY